MGSSGRNRRRATRKGGGSIRAREQRQLRERRGEAAFIFDKDLRFLGEVEREEWDLAVSLWGGDVFRAAAECGVDGAGPGAKALWGRSREEALSAYRHWQKRRRS